MKIAKSISVAALVASVAFGASAETSEREPHKVIMTGTSFSAIHRGYVK